MDFEAYLNTNAPAAERESQLADLLRNEDAAGIEYAVVMPSPTPKPDNRALYETAGRERRAVLCCQVNPNDGDSAFAEIRQAATEWNMRVLKIMPAIYGIQMTGPLARKLMTTARELGLVVNIHSGGGISHPLGIGALARRFPEVTVLMDHMGYREWSADAIEAAARELLSDRAYARRAEELAAELELLPPPDDVLQIVATQLALPS